MKNTIFLLSKSKLGWVPKIWKLGTLPNFAFEPRNYKTLGATLRNGINVEASCIAFQNVVVNLDSRTKINTKINY